MDYKTVISNIFSPRKNLFAVPNYQRAYSWEKEKEITQFLTDLKEHPQSVEHYNLGHFLFETDEYNKNKYWIIDGQQRLTTVVIFLSCVYNRIKNDENYKLIATNIYNEFLRNVDGEQKYSTVGYDNNFFENFIIEGVSDRMDTRSRRRIKEAFDFFTDEFNKNEVSISDILHWKDLIEEAKITTDTVLDKTEATQLFTFQNDRGKDLTELEKLKSFLMHNSYLDFNVSQKNPNNDISYIEKEFETIYQSLEEITIADEDQILNYHTIAFLSTEDTSLERVKKVLKKEENKSKWIKEFSVALKKSFATVIEIQKLRENENLIVDVLYLDQFHSFPLLLKLFHYHQIETLVKSLRLIEILFFKMQYTIGNYRTNRLHSIALNFKGDIATLEKNLLDNAKNGFKDYWNFTGDFIKCLEGDYHYWSISKYLLWKYENDLRFLKKDPKMSYADFANLYGKNNLENTLDHWTPQNPTGIEYEQEFKDKYLNNIGNLVLSTRGRNASDSNNLPTDRETNSTLLQRQNLEPFKDNWGMKEIKDRQDEIVVFAKRYWNPETIIQ